MAAFLKTQPSCPKQHPEFSVPHHVIDVFTARSHHIFYCHSLLNRFYSNENHQSPIAGLLPKQARKPAFGNPPLLPLKLLIASTVNGGNSAKLLHVTTKGLCSEDSDSFPCTFGSKENLTLLDADADFLLRRSSIVDGYGSKVNLAPRICTLREFRRFGEEIIAVGSDETLSAFFKSLAANVEFSAKIQDWEIFSGRLAMIVFVSAVLVEALTGNSVFQKLDPQRLVGIFAAVVMSILGAAGFAMAWQAKGRVPYTMSKGYEYLINAMIDHVIDDLLFDDEGP